MQKDTVQKDTVKAQHYKEVLAWITGWLAQRAPDAVIREETRFYDQGLVDSFVAVELINDAEDEFSIVFAQNDLASQDFQSVGGLARIISQHQAQQNLTET